MTEAYRQGKLCRYTTANHGFLGLTKMSDFSRRNYKAIARVFEARRLAVETENPGFVNERQDEIARAATALADVFERDNPNFNRVRFLQACDCEDTK